MVPLALPPLKSVKAADGGEAQKHQHRQQQSVGPMMVSQEASKVVLCLQPVLASCRGQQPERQRTQGVIV